MSFKQTVVFDFDGVINSYASGWTYETDIPDPPVPGIAEAINELRQTYKVVVQSTRCASPQGRQAVREYLDKYGIAVDGVTAEKPPALVYIDDRALLFDGNPALLTQRVREFQPWHIQNQSGESLGPKTPWKGRHPQEPIWTMATKWNEHVVITNWNGRIRYAVAVWDDGTVTYERLPDVTTHD